MVNDPFRALSHPIRRGIVERLADGPATVGVVTGGFGVSKPAISKHLKVLEETGVVKRVVEGRTHRLSLEPVALNAAADWMDRQRALWGRMFDVVDEYLMEEKRDEDAADRVAAGVGGRARAIAGGGEGADPRPRRAGRKAPPDAEDGR
jgi:DNA-binding transcriptional ArsR family regulator